ncbi:hypothetical protein H696_04133 [Fonticula alba]|uniref:Dickkopf N-terminal cysteine-rich domain-containing protein n=1 Tax=Fonticula alba TaxID=691883 RepID=A0A058Z864_FONAL|nr:hypothetical protein H696_04133 [Fonticula alba]KCV69727.1 hypothetical protein H696_04133 [Fonticula alba]|eukprot:XP_009496292.1 hypothetical protein H696_04133 [Fonticula alba]
MKLRTLVLGVLLLAFHAARADPALCGKYSLVSYEGQICDSTHSCTPSLYCNAGTCEQRLPAGATCLTSGQCVRTASCRGDPGLDTKTCVPNANLGAATHANISVPHAHAAADLDRSGPSTPGEACSSSDISPGALPACALPLVCDRFTSVCVGGYKGDVCTAGSQCQSEQCTGGVCEDVSSNTECNGPQACGGGFQWFCETPDNVCAEAQGAGQPCTLASMGPGAAPCGVGLFCGRYNSSEGAGVCLKEGELNNGEECTFNRACKSLSCNASTGKCVPAPTTCPSATTIGGPLVGGLACSEKDLCACEEAQEDEAAGQRAGILAAPGPGRRVLFRLLDRLDVGGGRLTGTTATVTALATGQCKENPCWKQLEHVV